MSSGSDALGAAGFGAMRFFGPALFGISAGFIMVWRLSDQAGIRSLLLAITAAVVMWLAMFLGESVAIAAGDLEHLRPGGAVAEPVWWGAITIFALRYLRAD